ncbi:hypothetical protein [Gudongella sp. SC589]|jgi:hypothetical protein|uniref:hypothetical protein n=1 Tax=Gudongella sp. SC589 TaxID=3385990 RepID=UPI003904D02D
MKVLFIRPGISRRRKMLLPLRLQEPLELAYLANQLQDSMQDKVEIVFLDMELERGSFKRQLLEMEPSLVVLWGEQGQEDLVHEQASMVKDIVPGAYVALAGELSEGEGSPYVDFLFRKNPVEAFNETVLGIITERSLQEINRNVNTIQNETIQEPLREADRGIFRKYQDRYYFLQYGGTVEVTSQQRLEFDEMGLVGKKDNPLRPLEDVVKDVESLVGASVYLKDRDIWDDPKRLKKFLELLKEKELQRSYISVGSWETILENESLLEEFAGMGLKVLLMEMDFPKDEDDWIYRGEVLRMLRKHGVEPAVVIGEKMAQEDQDALSFWLKDRKEGLVVLQGEAFEENRPIYTHVSISTWAFLKWTKDHGLGEARRRQKEYKNTLLI